MKPRKDQPIHTRLKPAPRPPKPQIPEQPNLTPAQLAKEKARSTKGKRENKAVNLPKVR